MEILLSHDHMIDRDRQGDDAMRTYDDITTTCTSLPLFDLLLLRLHGNLELVSDFGGEG